MSAIEKLLLAMAELPAQNLMVPKEYRLHPDDYAELRKQAKPDWITLYHDGTPEIFGLRIIEDSQAPRLPRTEPSDNRAHNMRGEG